MRQLFNVTSPVPMLFYGVRWDGTEPSWTLDAGIPVAAPPEMFGPYDKWFTEYDTGALQRDCGIAVAVNALCNEVARRTRRGAANVVFASQPQTWLN